MSILECVIDLIYPPRCVFCQNLLTVNEKKGICNKCKDKIIPVIGNRCVKCSSQIQDYEKGWALYNYDGRIKEAIYRFKYGGHEEYAGYFGTEIAERFKDEVLDVNIDLIIPVPIHKSRKKQRGFNQSEKIAKIVSKKLNIPLDSKSLIRIKNTKPQSKLSLRERKNNLKNAFCLQRKIKDNVKRVLIIDDIYTTGSTINNCAKVLKQNKIEKVYFISIAIANHS